MQKYQYVIWGIVALIIVVILAWLIVSYNNATPGSPLGSSAPQNSASITISSSGFLPHTVTIRKGSTVTWTNNDTVVHTVTADNGNGPHSPELGKGSVYNDTFVTTGTYAYHCTLHPEMKGTVIVVD